MDEIDALIDEVVSGEADAEVEDAEELAPDESAEDTAEDVDVDDDADDTEPSDDEAEPDEEGVPGSGDAAPDVTPPTPTQPTGPTPEQIQAYHEHIRLQNEQLAQLREAQRIREAEEQVAALQARWADMDPDDAHREELEFVADQYQLQLQGANQAVQTMRQQQATEEFERKEAAAKPLAIQKCIKEYELKPGDADLLSVAGTAHQMVEIAGKLQARRKANTSAARKQKAENLKANPALKGGRAGASVAAPVEEYGYGDLDKYLDEEFANLR